MQSCPNPNRYFLVIEGPALNTSRKPTTAVLQFYGTIPGSSELLAGNKKHCQSSAPCRLSVNQLQHLKLNCDPCYWKSLWTGLESYEEFKELAAAQSSDEKQWQKVVIKAMTNSSDRQWTEQWTVMNQTTATNRNGANVENDRWKRKMKTKRRDIGSHNDAWTGPSPFYMEYWTQRAM